MIHGWMHRRHGKPAAPATVKRARPSVEVLEDRTLPSATLLGDVNRTTAPAFTPAPPALVASAQVDQFVYFSADDGDHVNELWRTNGTAKGTTLVKAIGPDGGAFPAPATLAHLTALNHQLVFTVDDGVHGDELWVSDGTANGTRLVLDIRKSGRAVPPVGSYASDFVVVGNRAYFTADDGTHGREVWVTDGTKAGTFMIRDLDPYNSQNGDGPSNLIAFQDRLYFFARDASHGRELWTTNGTKSGTRLVLDVNHGAGDSAPPGFISPWFGPAPGATMAVAGNALYFAADDGINGVELWKTDGTKQGTTLVKDIFPGTDPFGFPAPQPNSSAPRSLTSVDGVLYFTANDGVNGTTLWTSNGTALGTHAVLDAGDPRMQDPRNLTAFGGKLWFTATNDVGGDALWVSDGSDDGTFSVQDIAPPPGPIPFPIFVPWFQPAQNLFAAGGILYFTAIDADHGRELWAVNPDGEGTHLVEDIRVGPAGSYISFMTGLGGNLLLVANDGKTGSELWTSDGTAAGTRLVKDINQHGGDANPSVPVRIGDTLYFSADDGKRGSELWKTDGTPQGTKLVKDINRFFSPGWFGSGDAEPAGSNIHDMVAVGNTLYFIADDGIHGAELWRSDGTTSGTKLVKDINTSPDFPIVIFGASSVQNAGSSIFDVTVMDGKLYFSADDGVHGRELWTSDGTAGGTRMVLDLNVKDFGFWPPIPEPFSDPLIPPVWGFGNQSSDPGELTVMNGKLYFAADDGDTGRELWVTGGTAETTHIVRDISPQPDGEITYPRGSNPSGFTRLGSTLFFSADDGAHGTELWRTDGTKQGTYMVRDINRTSATNPWTPDILPGSAYPQELTAAGNVLYFVADDGVNGTALWRSDGSIRGTNMVRAFRPGSQGFPAYLGELTAIGSQVFFSVDAHGAGTELWVSDGTRTGTRMVKDIFPGTAPNPFGPGRLPNSSFPTGLTAYNGRLYFIAEDADHGRELWSSDGTATGTTLVQDVLPGHGSGLGWASGLAVVADTLYFSANDGQHGLELWRL